MELVRWILARLVLTANAMTTPKGLIRSAEAQRLVDAATDKLALYQFEACPFCVKVRRAMTRQALNIELRDARNDMAIKQELVALGGRHKVPCLRIETPDSEDQWLYESNDIIAYLKANFSVN
jgi:glutaredoxin